MIRSKEENKELENEYYRLQEEYLETGSREAWESMWLIMQSAIESSIKKQLKGRYRDDFDDLVLDATVRIMQRYINKSGYRVTHLLTYARFEALNVLYNPRQQFNDKVLTYENWTDNYIERERKTNKYGNSR